MGPSPIGSPVPIGVEVTADGFVSPVQLVHAPGNNGRRFVVDQIGLIWGLTPSGNVMPQPFLGILAIGLAVLGYMRLRRRTPAFVTVRR